MGFRFRRSFKIAPGVRLNLNSKSTSVRIGPKGLGYTISSTGKKRVSASIPGTGFSYSQSVSPGRTAQRNGPPGGGRRGNGLWPVVATVVVIIFGFSMFSKPSSRLDADAAAVAPPASVSPPTLPTVTATPGPGPRAPPTSSTEPKKAAVAPVVGAPAAITPQRPVSVETRYVTATSLNVRASPSTSSDVISKVRNAEEIRVLETGDGWLLIQLAGGQQGWVSEQYTSRARVVAPPPAQALVSVPQNQSRDDIVQEIINRSIRSYSGNCPCPYNRTAAGRRCGGNSAYSRPGGRSPICFPSDVTDAMVAAFAP